MQKSEVIGKELPISAISILWGSVSERHVTDAICKSGRRNLNSYSKFLYSEVIYLRLICRMTDTLPFFSEASSMVPTWNLVPTY